MNDTGQRKARLLLSSGLSVEEMEAAEERAWKEVFGEDGRKDGPFHQYLFLASHYAGMQSLENRGMLDFFHGTQRLPDYRRAEDAIKRGWARWMQLVLGVDISQDKDWTRRKQHFLLCSIRSSVTQDARRAVLQTHAELIRVSARKGDTDFFRRLGIALDQPPAIEGNPNAGTYDFAHVLLHNWLAGFWWLMPIKAVAAEIAWIQGCPEDAKLMKSFIQNAWKIRSRKTKNPIGAFFSAGWTGCFYSTVPPVIDSIGSDRKPLLTTVGRRLLPH